MHKIPKQPCLNCNKTLWDDNPVVPARPGFGCVCAFCGHYMKFDDNLMLHTALPTTAKEKEASFMVKLARALDIDVDHFVRTHNNAGKF